MEDTKKDTKQNTKTSLRVLEPKKGLFAANLEAVGKDFYEKHLKNIKPQPCAIDNEVIVKGLRNPQYLVQVGFSTRKLIDAARRTDKEISFILVVEPNVARFMATMEREYIGDLVQDKHVDFILGVQPEEIVPYVYKIMTDQNIKNFINKATRAAAPEVIADPFAYKEDPDKIVSRVTKAIQDSVRQTFQAMGCASDSHFRWEQTWRNRQNIYNSYRIKPLFKKFDDIPAIVLGAGPSAKEFISEFKKKDLSKKAIIIACDAALKLCLDEGIKPHLVTRCERKFTTIFEGVTPERTSDIYYAAYPWTSPEYFSLFDKSFMLYRNNGVCQWSGYDPGFVDGGVSSANAAFELAYLLGCKNIILSGVDLCFIDDRSHVEGTEVEFNIEASKSKWQKIEGNTEKEVTTIPVWFRCLNEYLMSMNKHLGQANVFNVSQKGAKIHGADITTWDALVEKEVLNKEFDVLKRIESFSEKHDESYKKKFDDNASKTAALIDQVAHDLKKLQLTIHDAMITTQREEEKLVLRCHNFTDPRDFFMQTSSAAKSLVEVFSKQAQEVDDFKKKYLSSKLFGWSLLDIMQHEYFTLENKLGTIANTIEHDYEKIRQYVLLHQTFFTGLRYYANLLSKMIRHNEFEHDVKAKII